MEQVLRELSLLVPFLGAATLWIGGAAWVAITASKAGYHAYAWFGLGMVVSPLIALLLLLALRQRSRDGHGPQH